jgi:uncharacterized membrane protein
VGLLVMILGLVLFFGVHLISTKRQLRASFVAAMGEGFYKAVYGVMSLVGLVLIAWGFAAYRKAGMIEVAASYIRGRIYVALKHPMLAGIKLWAAAHLLANGDLGSIILFGSFLAWAVFDRISLKHRADAGAPPIPVGGLGNDFIAVAVGIVAYLALAFVFHPVVIGVPVIGV